LADAALGGVAFLVAYGVKGARPGVVESGLGRAVPAKTARIA